MTDINFPILSILIFLPIVGGISIYFINKITGTRGVQLYALLIGLIELVLSLYAYYVILNGNSGAEYNFVEGPYSWITSIQGIDYYLGMDGLSAPLVLISSILSVLVILGSWNLIKERNVLYYSLLLIFVGAIMGVFTSLNMILFYVFWDVVLIPMFIFIGIWGGPRRKYAAMKFLLFTFAGSVFMLLAFIMIYFVAVPNTFNIPELMGQIPYDLQVLASFLFFLGFGVKLAIVPFHTWLPDAHVEAPAPISVFLAGLLLKMGGYGFIRFNLGLLPEASAAYSWFFISIGIITMFYGAIVALRQTDLKRMIALTSINHMGFVLLGAFTGTLLGISGSVFQMFTHAFAVGIMFMLSGYVHEFTGTRDINIIKGLKFSSPRLATLLVLGSMAAMAIPIFSTFLSEFMVIVGAIQINPQYAVTAVIPVITVSYFLWMIKRTVTSTPEKPVVKHDLNNLSTVALCLYLLPLLLTLIAPWLILEMIDPLSQFYVDLFNGGS